MVLNQYLNLYKKYILALSYGSLLWPPSETAWRVNYNYRKIRINKVWKKHKWFSMFSTFLIRIAAEKDKGNAVENKKYIFFSFSFQLLRFHTKSVAVMVGPLSSWVDIVSTTFSPHLSLNAQLLRYIIHLFFLYREVYVSFLYDILYFRFLLLCTCLDLFHITKNIAQIRIYIHRHVPHEQSAKSRKKVERMAFGCEIEHGGEHKKKLSNVSVLIVFFSFSISLIRTIACNHWGGFSDDVVVLSTVRLDVHWFRHGSEIYGQPGREWSVCVCVQLLLQPEVQSIQL